MASGFGLHGGPGRCHSFIVDYRLCVVSYEILISFCFFIFLIEMID